MRVGGHGFATTFPHQSRDVESIDPLIVDAEHAESPCDGCGGRRGVGDTLASGSGETNPVPDYERGTDRSATRRAWNEPASAVVRTTITTATPPDGIVPTGDGWDPRLRRRVSRRTIRSGADGGDGSGSMGRGCRSSGGVSGRLRCRLRRARRPGGAGSLRPRQRRPGGRRARSADDDEEPSPLSDAQTRIARDWTTALGGLLQPAPRTTPSTDASTRHRVGYEPDDQHRQRSTSLVAPPATSPDTGPTTSRSSSECGLVAGLRFWKRCAHPESEHRQGEGIEPRSSPPPVWAGLGARSDAGAGGVGPFELHGVAGEGLGLPGADVADFAVVVVVPSAARDRIGDRLAQFVGAGRRQRGERGE